MVSLLQGFHKLFYHPVNIEKICIIPFFFFPLGNMLVRFLRVWEHHLSAILPAILSHALLTLHYSLYCLQLALTSLPL